MQKQYGYAVCSGVKGIFTAHGASIDEVKSNPAIKSLIQSNTLDRIIILAQGENKGEVEKAFALNKMNGEYYTI